MYYIYIFFWRFGSDITEILQQNIRNKPALFVPAFISSQTPAVLHRPQRRPGCLEMPRQDSFSSAGLLQEEDSLRGKAGIKESRRIVQRGKKPQQHNKNQRRSWASSGLVSTSKALTMSKAISVWSRWRFDLGYSIWGSCLQCKDVESVVVFPMKP